jgi:hypothetical protein
MDLCNILDLQSCLIDSTLICRRKKHIQTSSYYDVAVHVASSSTVEHCCKLSRFGRFCSKPTYSTTTVRMNGLKFLLLLLYGRTDYRQNIVL